MAKFPVLRAEILTKAKMQNFTKIENGGGAHERRIDGKLVG